MTEQKHVWEPLRNGAPRVHWMRLENIVGTGMSDLNGCLDGVEAWVENKIIHGNQMVFQPKQPAWIIKRLLHGGRVFVLARKDDRLVLYGGPELAKLMLSAVPKGKHLIVDHRTVAPLMILAKPFDWELLTDEIFGHGQARLSKAA